MMVMVVVVEVVVIRRLAASRGPKLATHGLSSFSGDDEQSHADTSCVGPRSGLGSGGDCEGGHPPIAVHRATSFVIVHDRTGLGTESR